MFHLNAKLVWKEANNDNMTICGLSLHQGNTESHKNPQAKIFNLALLTLMESMNVSRSNNLVIIMLKSDA